MPSLHRFPPHVIAGALLFMITFYYVYNVRSKNSDLERNVKVFKEALIVSKEKNKVLVQDAMEKVAAKDARIQQLEKEHLAKHTKLGETQALLAKMKSNLKSKEEEIEKLHQSAESHRDEISTLTKSVRKSKMVFTKLSAKANNLMLDHKKLKKENTELMQENKKLQSEIKQYQSARGTLKEQMKTLKKEKEDLGMKVDDLTRKNEVIQESIKQKIKESYAARREMIQAKHTKETEHRRLGTLQDSTHKTVNTGETNPKVPQRFFKSSKKDPVTKAIIDNSDKNTGNLANISINSIDTVSKVMVDSSNTGNESEVIGNIPNDADSRNISRVMVNNSNDTERNVPRILVDNHVESKDKNQSLPGESRFSLAGFQSEKDSENVDQEKNEDENFEKRTQNRNVDGEGVNENKDQDGVNENKDQDGVNENKDQDGVNENKDQEDTDEKKDESLGRKMKNGNMDGEGLDEHKDQEGLDKNLEEKMENRNMDGESLDKNENLGRTMEDKNMDGKDLGKNEEQNLETQEENGITRKESASQEKDDDISDRMRKESDTLPETLNIEDEMMNSQSSKNTYGEHLRDSFKPNSDSFGQRDSH